MGTLEEKARAAIASKEAVKDAISEMGGTITEATTFAEYGDAVRSIPQGSIIPETDAQAGDVLHGKTFVMNIAGEGVQATGTMPEATFVDGPTSSGGYMFSASTGGHVSAGTITTIPAATYTENDSSAYIGIGYNGTARSISKGGGSGDISDGLGLYAGTITANVSYQGTVSLHGSACLIAGTVAGTINLFEAGQPADQTGSEPVISGDPSLIGANGAAVTLGGQMFVVCNAGSGMGYNHVIPGDCILASGASAQAIAYDSMGGGTYTDHPVCGGTMSVMEGAITSDCLGETTVNSGGSITANYISSGSLNIIAESGDTSASYSNLGATVTGGTLTAEYSSMGALDVQSGVATLSSTYIGAVNQAGGVIYANFEDLQNAQNTSFNGGTLYLTGSASEYSYNTVTTYNTVSFPTQYAFFDGGGKLQIYGEIQLPDYSTVTSIYMGGGTANIGNGATLDGTVGYATVNNNSGGMFGSAGGQTYINNCTVNNSGGYVYGTVMEGTSYIDGGNFDGIVQGGSVFVSSASVDAQVYSGYIELRGCSCSYQTTLYGGTMTVAEYSNINVQIQANNSPSLYVSSGCSVLIRNEEWEVSQYVYAEDGAIVTYQPY